jgi:hypothetical protein
LPRYDDDQMMTFFGLRLPEQKESTAFVAAAQYGHEAVVRLLLEHKADPGVADQVHIQVMFIHRNRQTLMQPLERILLEVSLCSLVAAARPGRGGRLLYKTGKSKRANE